MTARTRPTHALTPTHGPRLTDQGQSGAGPYRASVIGPAGRSRGRA